MKRAEDLLHRPHVPARRVHVDPASRSPQLPAAGVFHTYCRWSESGKKCRFVPDTRLGTVPTATRQSVRCVPDREATLRTARAQRCLQTRIQTDNELKNSMFRGAASCADGDSPMMDWMVSCLHSHLPCISRASVLNPFSTLSAMAVAYGPIMISTGDKAMVPASFCYLDVRYKL